MGTFGITSDCFLPHETEHKPSPQQLHWMRRGLSQPGGKLPLFDEEGQRINSQTVQSCIRNGWVKPWFANPLKPDWEVCKLTDEGRQILEEN